MKEYVWQFLINVDMDINAAKEFVLSADSLLENYVQHLAEIDSIYKSTKKIRNTLDLRKILSENSGVNIYTVNAVVIILASLWLYDDYRAKGYTDEIFWDTMSDLKCKLLECLEIKGVLGTFVEDWYDGFVSMDIFMLGRLEFERTVFNEETPCEVGGITVNKGDRVYSVHIPSCGPMPKAARLDSYKKAYEFFQGENKNKPLICICDSWLLFSKNDEIFPFHLNIVDFLKDWKIFKSVELDEYYDCWRLFGRDYNNNPDELPEDTTARRCMKNWLKEGNKAGVGKGIMLFDGERLITA